MLDQPFHMKRENINSSMVTQGMNEHEMYNFYVSWLGRENDEKNIAFLKEQQGYKNFKTRKNRHLKTSMDFKQSIRNHYLKMDQHEEKNGKNEKAPAG